MAEKLRFEEFFAAPREQVFDFFADPAKLARLWGGRWKQLRPGPDPAHPNGAGSVRSVRAGMFKFEETITVYQPHQLIEYQITSGGNVKSHLARIAFSDKPGGTQVVYTIDFESKFPGTGKMLAATLGLAWTVGVPKVQRELASASPA